MRKWAVLAAAGLVCSLPAVPVHATTVKPKRGALQVVLAGDSGDAPRSVVVTGPRSYQRTLTRTTTVKRLVPGRYRIAATTRTTALGEATATPSARTLRVKRGKTTRTTITFGFVPTQSADGGPAPAPPTPPPTTPPSDTTAPGVVSALTVIPGGDDVGLSWTNPSDPDLAQVIVRRSQGAVAPTSPTTGTPVALPTSTASSATDSGLSQKTQYSYSVFTRDAAGNTSDCVSITTVTKDLTAPAVPGLTVSPVVVSNTPGLQASVSVPADDDLDKLLMWRVPGDVAPDTTTTPLDEFTGLTPGTFLAQQQGGLAEQALYTYGVVAVDTAGNRSALATGTAMTPGIPPGPVTGASSNVNPTNATISWLNPTDPDFSKAIVRYAEGTISVTPAPPATATSGSSAPALSATSAQFQVDPLVKYAVSIFTVDTRGNVNPTPVTLSFTAPNGTGGIR